MLRDQRLSSRACFTSAVGAGQVGGACSACAARASDRRSRLPGKLSPAREAKRLQRAKMPRRSPKAAEPDDRRGGGSTSEGAVA